MLWPEYTMGGGGQPATVLHHNTLDTVGDVRWRDVEVSYQLGVTFEKVSISVTHQEVGRK